MGSQSGERLHLRWQTLTVGILHMVFAWLWIAGSVLAIRDARRDEQTMDMPVSTFDQMGDEVYQWSRDRLERQLAAAADEQERAYLEGQLRWLRELKGRHEEQMAQARRQRRERHLRRTVLAAVHFGTASLLGLSGLALVVTGRRASAFVVLALLPLLIGVASLYAGRRISPGWTHLVVKLRRETRESPFPDMPMLRDHRAENRIRDVGFGWAFVYPAAAAIVLLAVRRKPERAGQSGRPSRRTNLSA